MFLEDIPGIRGRKEVHKFVKDHLSMLFEDIRGIIVQPGYNFACANLLCDLISGLSVTVYKPASASTKIGAGAAFKSLLLSPFFPWEPTDTPKDQKEKASALYDYVRNPMTHAIGLDEKPGLDIAIGKNPKPLSKRELAQMEKAPNRPASITPALVGGGNKWQLWVEGLHYAVFRMFWNLAQDRGQMVAAEARFAAGVIAWRKF
jgi:hypothetical protein